MDDQQKESPVDRLLRAAARGDLKKIASQHSVGGGLANTFTELKDNKCCTALHLAAGEGKTQMCRYLVRDLKVNVDLKDGSGDTPLNYAALAEQYQTGQKKFVELVISKGADIETESSAGTPLHCAAASGKKEAVKLLLNSNANAGADPNLSSSCGPLLVYAAGAGEKEAIRLLLKSGADPNATDDYGTTPLEAVARHGCHEGIMMLLPVTHRIPVFPDWSFAEIISHVHSEQY